MQWKQFLMNKGNCPAAFKIAFPRQMNWNLVNVNRWDGDTMYCDLMISRRFRVLETEALTVGRRKGGVSIGGRLDLGLVDSDEPFE